MQFLNLYYTFLPNLNIVFDSSKWFYCASLQIVIIKVKKKAYIKTRNKNQVTRQRGQVSLLRVPFASAITHA